MTSRAVLRLFLLILLLLAAHPAEAQEHGTAQPQPGAASETAGQDAHEEEQGGLLQIVAKLFNFGILAGVLVYFLRGPVGEYLGSRSSQIRHDLVTAAEVRRTATAQLEEIERRLASLPGELDALKVRGAEDTKAEEARIAQAAAAERERLLQQTRREIDTRLRIARRELMEHAAQLAVAVAEQRISRTITPDDQLRLVDRYAAQLKEAP